MSKQILVKAAPLADPALAGQARVVKEGTMRRYITEDPKGVLVPLSGYYSRKLANGELVPVTAPPPEEAETAEVPIPSVVSTEEADQ